MSQYFEDTTYFRRDAHFKNVIINGIYGNLGSITLNGDTITHWVSGGGGGGTWGTITGDIIDQLDLQESLSYKANTSDLTPITNNLNTLSGNVLILSAYDIQNTLNLSYLSGSINDIQSDVLNIAVVSGNWNSTYTTVQTNSADWNTALQPNTNIIVTSLSSNSISANSYELAGVSLSAWPVASGGTWGTITGILSSQTDLKDTLDTKANVSGQIFTGAIEATNITDSGLTITRIPYSSTGGLLVDSSTLTYSATAGLATTKPIIVTGSSNVVQLKVIANATQTANLLDVFASDGTTPKFHISGSGNVSIGIAADANVRLFNKQSTSDGTTSKWGQRNYFTFAPSANTALFAFGASNEVYKTGGQNMTGVYGTGGLIGLFNKAINNGIGTVSNSYGGIFSNHSIGGGITTNAYSLYIPDVFVTGAGSAITNNYGLYIENQIGGTTLNYSIYSVGGNNYFGGNVGIGTTPTAKLHSLATTEQLRLGYDASNYKSETVSSIGSVTTDLTGTSPKNIFSQAIRGNGGFESSDGSAGITATKVFNDGAVVNTVTIKNGLITDWTQV